MNTVFLVREIRRNEQQDSFLNAVTHELKTPIASIRMYLETLTSRQLDEPQRRDFYRIMLEDTDRLLGTVEQVLKAGEARQRSNRKNWQELDFSELVKSALDLTRLRHHLTPDNLRFGAAPQEGLLVLGNPEELRTVVFNLFDNAVTGGAGERYGAGAFYCAVDRATTWRRRLRGKRRRGTGQHVYGPPAENLSGMSRILIVEDEAHLAQGLRFNLEAEGHSVEISDRGEEALARLLKKNESYDALVLDVMLPGKDGFSVARELREAKNYIPLLMLTARGRAEDVLKGFESGADDYLPKPFNLAILLARIESLLRRKSGRRGTRYRARRFWRTSGIYTKTRTPARSTISSCACGDISSRNRASRCTC